MRLFRALQHRYTRMKRFRVPKWITTLINVILIYFSYKALVITYESYSLDEPLWHVTKHHLNKPFYPPNDYFAGGSKKPLKHSNIRVMLQNEHYKSLVASELNYTSYFEDLEETVYSLEPLQYTGDFQSFMESYTSRCRNLSLSFSHPERSITNNGKPVIWDTIFLDNPYETLSRNDLLIMSFDEIFLHDLSLKHEGIIQSLPSGNQKYFSNSGYVVIGGGIYSWYALLTIQTLRNSGSSLPVEVMIPSNNEIDEEYCQLLTRWNAKCISFEDIYGPTVLSLGVRGYQLKAMAIIGSSFSNVLYLDSDILILKNPDKLFTSTVFEKFGFITWPDFWRRTTSPLLYETIGHVGGSVRFLNDFWSGRKGENYHDRQGTLAEWSTEAGLLLINKATHFSMLLLALYYNLNGPAGYYPLLSQGGAGEGDKETWALSALVLNSTHWQVNKYPGKTYGTWMKNVNWFVDSGIVQFDAEDDFYGISHLNEYHNEWESEINYNYDYMFGKHAYQMQEVIPPKSGVPIKEPRKMFYHLHSPKLDPWDYVLDNLFVDRSNRPLRNFGTIEDLGWDLERWIWEYIEQVLCHEGEVNHALQNMQCFNGRDFKRVCTEDGRLKSRIEWLKKN